MPIIWDDEDGAVATAPPPRGKIVWDDEAQFSDEAPAADILPPKPAAQPPTPFEHPQSMDEALARLEAQPGYVPPNERPRASGTAKIPKKILDRDEAEIAKLPPSPEREARAAQLDDARYQNYKADNAGIAQLYAPGRRSIGAMASVGSTAAGLGLRIMGLASSEHNKQANEVTRDRGYMNRYLTELDQQGGGTVGAIVGQAGQSLLEMGLTGGMGGPAKTVAASAASMAATKGKYFLPYLFTKSVDDGYVAAKDAGSDEPTAILHGLNSGAIDAGLTALFGHYAGKLGGITPEELIGNPGLQQAATRMASRHGIKPALIGILAEAGEEGTITGLKQIEDIRAGVGKWDSLFTNIAVSAATGGVMGAGAHGLNAALSKFKNEAPIAAKAVKEAQAWAKEHPDKVAGAVGSRGRREFATVTGKQRTTQQYRQTFLEELARLETESTNAEVATPQYPDVERVPDPDTPGEHVYAPVQETPPTAATPAPETASVETTAEGEYEEGWLDDLASGTGTDEESTGVPLGKVSVDTTRVQELMDQGASKQEAIDIAARESGKVTGQVPPSEPAAPATPPPSIYKQINRDAIPADMEVDIEVIRGKTKERITMKQNAREALAEFDEDAALYHKILDCMK